MPIDPRDKNQDGTLSPVELADINGDGRIDFRDLMLLSGSYGQTVPGPPVVAAGVNTLQTIIDDMTLPHMGRVAGTTGYSWEFGPQYRTWQRKGPMVDAWAILVHDQVHEGGVVPQVEVADFRLYGFVNNVWQQIDSGIYGSQINAENFGAAILGDEGSGPQFTIPANKGVQFYLGFVPAPAGLTAMWARYKARLLNDDGSYIALANCGGDWGQTSPTFSDYGDWGFGRLKRLTAAWQYMNVATLDAVGLAVHIPPL